MGYFSFRVWSPTFSRVGPFFGNLYPTSLVEAGYKNWRMNIRIVSAVALVLLLTGCYYDKEAVLYPTATDCSSLNVSFSRDIQPLIQSRCAVSGCHDASSGNKGGPFTTYTQIQFKASNIKVQVVSGNMPQGGTLTAAQIKLISCWVDGGAVNN
jgi:hypothetical protein